MEPSQEPLLTVNDLFCKARQPPARLSARHRSPAAPSASASASTSTSASASASASASSQPLGRAHSQARVVTFVGQIVHVLTNTHPEQKITAVPQDPLRYPLQRHAQRLYQKKCNDLPLDLILWLAPLGAQAHSTLQASRVYGTLEDSKAAAEQKNQGAITTYSLVKNEDSEDLVHVDGNSTALSWSDSDRSQSSQTDSGSDGEALDETPLPETMVAVLLSGAFDQDRDTDKDGNKDKDKDKVVHWKSLQKRLKPGNFVTVHKAVMLFDEVNGKKVVSCVGIPDRTTFKVSPRPYKSTRPSSSTRASQRTLNATRTSRNGSEKRKPSPDSSSSGQQEAGRPLLPAKRMRICPEKLDGNKDRHEMMVSRDHVEYPLRSIKQESSTGFGKGVSVRKPPVPVSTQAPNSLRLLVRRIQGHTFSNTDREGEKITYFSTLLSNVTYRASDPGSSRVAIEHGSRSGSSSSDRNTSRSSSVSSNSHAEQTAATRHICWLRDIRRAALRAVCAECGNNYRNLSCVFGCRSRTWRLGIQMECIMSDGTGQARVMITDDQEDVLWTLLGLKIKTGTTRSISNDLSSVHANSRNAVLAIVARRGELSYRTNSPDSPEPSSLSLASSSGHVETIDDDRSERAQIEERLWLNICNSCPSVERTFVLEAVVNRGSSRATAQPSTSTDRPVKLKTSLVRLGPETTILTLVPPPLVLCAVDVKRIEPKTEARMLLSLLRG